VACVNHDNGRQLAEALRALEEVPTWAARTAADASRLRPALLSQLQQDDAKADPYHLSHAVWRSLSTSVDHLACLQVLLVDAKVIHMYAPFSLLRAALENSCAAVWLLEPASSADRLSRHFRKVLDDIRNEEQVRGLMRQPGTRTEAERLASVRALASTAGLTDAAVKARPTYWEIVKTVSESGPANSVIEVMWKLCSGYAHGDSWPTLSASQRTQIDGAAPEGVGTFKIEANIGLLAKVTTMAVKVTGWGWQLHDQRCAAPGRR